MRNRGNSDEKSEQTYADTGFFLFKTDILQFHFLKRLLQFVDVAKAQSYYIICKNFYPVGLLRHQFLGKGHSRSDKHFYSHFTFIRQEQIRALYLLHSNVYAYRLGKAQHLDWNRDRHSTFIYIPKLYFLMVMTGHILLQLSISN